jgi:hypothetical protein
LTNYLLQKAFDLVFDKVGERTKKELIEDLQRQGILLNDPDLTLVKLAMGLECVVGKDASKVVIHQMVVKLDELHNNKKG